MRILLDEQLPRQLTPYFVGHEVRTTQEQGWAGLRNGVLPKHALAAAFEVFITGEFVVVIVAPTNKLEDLLPRVPGAWEAIGRATPGEVERVAV